MDGWDMMPNVAKNGEELNTCHFGFFSFFWSEQQNLTIITYV